MSDDPLIGLDFTVELGFDVWERPESQSWCFGCLPCGIFLEFGHQAAAEIFMEGHTCRTS